MPPEGRLCKISLSLQLATNYYALFTVKIFSNQHLLLGLGTATVAAATEFFFAGVSERAIFEIQSPDPASVLIKTYGPPL